jgi:uncharacterized membrane protein (DUF106 family)
MLKIKEKQGELREAERQKDMAKALKLWSEIEQIRKSL